MSINFDNFLNWVSGYHSYRIFFRWFFHRFFFSNVFPQSFSQGYLSHSFVTHWYCPTLRFTLGLPCRSGALWYSVLHSYTIFFVYSIMREGKGVSILKGMRWILKKIKWVHPTSIHKINHDSLVPNKILTPFELWVFLTQEKKQKKDAGRFTFCCKIIYTLSDEWWSSQLSRFMKDFELFLCIFLSRLVFLEVF